MLFPSFSYHTHHFLLAAVLATITFAQAIQTLPFSS
jgi:hypothetical protein